ncbi:14224_t:CDS:1, partial [Racocetra fulgida]
SSGVTIWSCWPLDFVSIDIPIVVTLTLMTILGYGNSMDVSLLQHNPALVILATFYLVWRIISGFWYLSISLSVRARENNTYNQLTEEISSQSFLDSFKK